MRSTQLACDAPAVDGTLGSEVVASIAAHSVGDDVEGVWRDGIARIG